jgi:hypothetical protein
MKKLERNYTQRFIVSLSFVLDEHKKGVEQNDAATLLEPTPIDISPHPSNPILIVDYY